MQLAFSVSQAERKGPSITIETCSFLRCMEDLGALRCTRTSGMFLIPNDGWENGFVALYKIWFLKLDKLWTMTCSSQYQVLNSSLYLELHSSWTILYIPFISCVIIQGLSVFVTFITSLDSADTRLVKLSSRTLWGECEQAMYYTRAHKNGRLE